MSVNATAWGFIQSSEDAWAAYLQPLLPEDVIAVPALTTDKVQAPQVSVRNTSIRPFTDGAAIVSHVSATATLTVRTAYDEDQDDAGRSNHAALVAHVMGCVMQVDGTTKENALPSLLTLAGGGAVEFSMAAWSAMTSGIDAEARHFVTRVEVETIISQPTGA